MSGVAAPPIFLYTLPPLYREALPHLGHVLPLALPRVLRGGLAAEVDLEVVGILARLPSGRAASDDELKAALDRDQGTVHAVAMAPWLTTSVARAVGFGSTGQQGFVAARLMAGLDTYAPSVSSARETNPLLIIYPTSSTRPSRGRFVRSRPPGGGGRWAGVAELAQGGDNATPSTP